MNGILHHIDRGSGSPALVFIHGFTCSSSDWSAQLPELSREFRCVAVDLPGHGASPAPAEASIRALSAAVNSTLDALELNEVVLIGHSMGCRIVSETTCQSAGRVRGVVYVDGSIVAAADPDAAVQAAHDMLARMTVRGFIARLYEDFHVASTPQSVRDAVNAHLPRIDLDFAQRLWFDLVRWDATHARARLAALSVPALAIQSTYLDAAMQRASLPPGAGSPWTDAVSGTAMDAKLSVIPGVGHFPQLEAPAQTNALIRAFVRGLTQHAA